MIRTFVIFFMLCVLFSCTEPYEADINTDQEVLVIDAYLDNRVGFSYVSLTRSVPFDTITIPKRVKGARVSLKDNTGTTINYKETSYGYYIPVNASFKGEVNKSYTLMVDTQDGVFVSKPETLLPQLNPALISGGYAKEEKLEKNYNGDIRKIVNDICEVYFDFGSAGAEIPRFRFTSSQIVEYTYFIELMPPVNGISGYLFYCWFVTDDNSLRFTSEKYHSSGKEIKKQLVCVTPPDKKILVPVISLKTMFFIDSVMDYFENKRILRINQFRLNEDSYNFYKGIENQISAEGKIFDPLPAQLYGNITCKSDPEIPVLGFFEVSNASTFSWSISRYGPKNPVTFTSVPNIYPTKRGLTINTPPSFWIE